MRKAFILSFCVIFTLLSANSAKAGQAFNPSFLISDYELLDYNSMSISDIQDFLENRASYLANYKTFDANYEIKSAAEIIYNASVNNFNCDGVELSSRPTFAEKKFKCQPFKTINPKFLLVLLQKEQGLIDNRNPERGRLDWAMGYGCPDGGGCNSRWRGFGKQVNSAALQFRDYMDNPQNYKYKINRTYHFTNPYSTSVRAESIVTPTNNATAALYNYTPHVYNGNYNFWVIWNRYFRTTYPNGSLLQAKGEAGVWLIQNDQKRPFLSKAALVSRFDLKKIIQVDKAVLSKFEIGAPIRFPQYSIIQDPDGKLWLLVDNKRRGFTNIEAFRRIGYNPEEIMNASWEDINSYEESKPITENSAYPMGALLQDDMTGGVYWVEEGVKAPILERIFLEVKFKGRKIIPVSPHELARYQTVEPIKFNDGELVKIDKAPGVYVIDQGQLRAIKSAEVFESMGYKWENIVTISPKVFLLYTKGEPIQVLGAVEETE
ncbi:MAG: hypothetical protein ABIG10_02180 [bacterium]